MDLVTDRTEYDVTLGNTKGVYSYADLNRVENAVKLAADEAAAMGYNVHLKTKTDWGLPADFSTEEWPVESQMERYLNNVAVLKKTFLVSTEIPRSMDRLTWAGANNIEKVLETALLRIAGIKQNYRYSGEIFAGEETL